MNIAALLNLSLSAARVPDAPWPDQLDVALWCWRAAPEVWRDEYDTGNDYEALMSNPAVWGLTGGSYTSPSPVSVTTPGWTMGGGGRFDLRFSPQASFGYRLWKSMLAPLDWARLITDRTAARLDPAQAPEGELPYLIRWANVDPLAVRGLDTPMLRRVTAHSRALENWRGTDLSGEAISAMLGGPVALGWDPVTPFTRIVSCYAQVTPAVRRFLRRCLPPHLNGELHAFTGVADYTGGAYTARAQQPGGVVESDIYSVTASLTETTETF